MPVMMYLLFTNLGDGGDGGWKTGSMIGMAAYGAVGSALNTGGGVAEDRVTGWLRQLRVTPMTPREVVSADADRLGDGAARDRRGAGGGRNGRTAYGWGSGSRPRSRCCCGSARYPSPCSASATATGSPRRRPGSRAWARNLGLSVVGGLVVPAHALPGLAPGPCPASHPRTASPSSAPPSPTATAPALGAVVVLTAWLLAFGRRCGLVPQGRADHLKRTVRRGTGRPGCEGLLVR